MGGAQAPPFSFSQSALMVGPMKTAQAFPVIVIHSLDHAKAALGAAAELGVPVTLISAPGAVAYLGATVFRDIARQAAQAFPDARFDAVLDCGDEPGLALGAMRHGVPGVCVHVLPEVEAKLAENAAKRGCRVHHRGGPELDLLGMTDPKAACLSWLAPLPAAARKTGNPE